MQAGQVVADRFEIEHLAGAGAMGAVYAARDRKSGERVAVKVALCDEAASARFVQEGHVLAQLDHPAIVRYVAHGVTEEGAPFLAMEWLDGEDLARRLARGPLEIGDSLALVGRVAAALTAAHARGILHRDVKPSNLLLVGGDAGRVKVLDFGVARAPVSGWAETARDVTRTGVVLGTLGYMSPEQATGEKDLDARSDVFSLGCVLFECLTGHPPFRGEHAVAVLAKVLCEEAPRLRQLRPELPDSLEDLVRRMLAKQKAARPVDAAAVGREIDALGPLTEELRNGGEAAREALSIEEQRLAAVMLAIVPADPQQVGEIVRRHGGDLVQLANGAMLVTLRGPGMPSPYLVAAADCALALRDEFRGTRIALATGHAQAAAGSTLGPVIDRAAALLVSSIAEGIHLDPVAAGLLAGRFEVRNRGPQGGVLVRRTDFEMPRLLLGKLTPCVGREKELQLLDGTLRECVEDSVARAVVVSAPAGQGKSRLRHEFLLRTRERQGEVKVLAARGDPLGAGAPLALVRQLVRHATGTREGEPATVQRENVHVHVSRILHAGEAEWAEEFLAEMLGAGTPDASPALRAARSDPSVMAEWFRRSFMAWMAGELRASPLLIVLEDVHWGDPASLAYVGDALRELPEQPLMVLALIRPERGDAVPKPWSGIAQEIALAPLTRRATERLVQAAIGDVSPATLARIVERGAGNAFYVEELIRSVADRSDDSLPDTVLALVQSRLERLEPEARRVLRAASVFGERAWRGGIAALLRGTRELPELDAWLRVLAEREVLVLARSDRFAAETEYAFRHGLVRDAVYSTLTDVDRVTGHRLAAEWLERAGESDPLVLAHHHERCGDGASAARCLLAAAQAALRASDPAAALVLAERGARLPVEGADRGRLRFTRAVSLAWRGEIRAMRQSLAEALAELPDDEPAVVEALGWDAMTSIQLGETSPGEVAAQRLPTLAVAPSEAALHRSASYVTCSLYFSGRIGAADELIRSLSARYGDPREPLARGWQCFTRLLQARFSAGDPWIERQIGLEGADIFERELDATGRANMFNQVATAEVSLGAYSDALRHAEAALEIIGRYGLRLLSAHAVALAAGGAAGLGDRARARRRFEEALDVAEQVGDEIFGLGGIVFAAHAARLIGDAADAARACEVVVSRTKLVGVRAMACGQLAAALVELGRAEEALARCEEVVALSAPRRMRGALDLDVFAAMTRALEMLGRHDAAAGVRARGLAVVQKRAGRIEDPEVRASFLRTRSVAVLRAAAD